MSLQGYPASRYYTNFAGVPNYVHQHQLGLAAGGRAPDWPDGYGFLYYLTAGPAITVMMAHFFLADEALTWRKSIGVALALSGALLLTLRGESGLAGVDQASPIGYGLVFVAMLVSVPVGVHARALHHQIPA